MIDNKKTISKFTANYSYTGRIINGPYEHSLKKKIIKTIGYMDALEKMGTPMVPYIAAWKPDSLNIWYEHAGKGLKQILAGKGGDQLAEAFRNNLSHQYMYQKHWNSSEVRKNILDNTQLEYAKPFLRKLAEKTGKSEAVYRIESKGEAFWLKDIAVIETYPESGIIISIGTLIDVSNEMQLEDALTKTRGELEKHKQNLETLITKRTAELHSAQLDVVKRLVLAAEFRDDQTGSHNKRLSRYSAILGKNYGLTQGANWLLSRAIPMHDVGKVGIPDNILLKAGKLTPDEYDIIKTHCKLGYDLLDGGDSQLLKIAKVIALTHHEHWDGSGYPSGIKNHDIPIAGRITAICDVFDALTSGRPYKAPWTIEAAVEEITRLSGIQFDPHLVKIFLDSLSDIQRVYKEYSEDQKVSGY